MDFFAYNLSWMLFNTVLALVPVGITALLRKDFQPATKWALFLIWLLFLPNSIYLITDLQHLPYQFVRVTHIEQLMIVTQYIALTILGVITYMYSLNVAERILSRLKIEGIEKNLIYIGLHFLVAFGIVLGKVQRTHSWYVVTQPGRVARDIVETIYSPELIIFAILFGTLTCGIFFSLRRFFFTKKKSKSKK